MTGDENPTPDQPSGHTSRMSLWQESVAEWRGIFQIVVERSLRPIARVGALWYFFLFVVVLGSAGVWASLIWLVVFGGDIPGLVLSLLLSVLTYAAALASTSIMDTVLAKEPPSHKAVVSLLSITFGVLGALCLGMWKFHCRTDERGHLEFPWAWFCGSMLAWWAMWWMANASDERFRFSIDPGSAVGGNPLRDLEK